MVFYFQRKMTKDFFWRSTININKTLTVSFSMSCSCNASHKFWYQSPSPHYQCCLQVSEAGCWRKLFQYVATLSRGRELTSFCKVDNSRIANIFFRLHKTYVRYWLFCNTHIINILPYFQSKFCAFYIAQNDGFCIKELRCL